MECPRLIRSCRVDPAATPGVDLSRLNLFGVTQVCCMNGLGLCWRHSFLAIYVSLCRHHVL